MWYSVHEYVLADICSVLQDEAVASITLPMQRCDSYARAVNACNL